ncbi:hypothetical protein CALCODRAFT_556338 [Calocera cornea HHB12733]|uniref:Protein CPL1-like domain-containing protein n=1 Tax=Calocera cornea HHB12733 TaxID=1353952 RepID=A0A165EW46_9BASI|nr:hypothetical protein CALCODRAFT_556338 [Calocera cornea HHB12733]
MYTVRCFLGVVLSLLALSLPAAADYACNARHQCPDSVGTDSFCSGFLFSSGLCYYSKCHSPYELNDADCVNVPFEGKKCECKSKLTGSNYKRKRDLEACPLMQLRCPVYHGRGGSECVDVASDIESCGGCVGLDGSGTGVDCTSIDGAESVSCIDGTCVIDECARGYKLERNRSTCTPIAGMRVQKNPLKRNFRME